MQMQLDQLWLLRETAEIDINSAVGDVLKFRIERFEPRQSAARRNEHQFRVFRYDTFRVQPSVHAVLDHDTSSTWADHESLVVDPMFGIVRIAAENAEDAWKELWSRMQRQFSVK
jgi:hypothetical protein